ncbi:MAG: ABC transporter substrate-binding protein [Desulfobulbaceae bacterium]|jgi:NitT/TauT family transport system substrate-binding protein|nr:ABC transporter substrate-binding protein [Desulfobulbaceae bacterium]
MFQICFRFFSLCLPLLFLLAPPAQAALTQGAPLRLALLPVPDVFPAYVAEAEGFFAAEGVEVKLLPVGSAVERDQLMQAGQIDGMITDIVSVASLNRDKTRVKIVAIARVPIGSPLFRILVGKDSPIKNIGELAGVPIAISRNTVIECVTSKMLASLPDQAIIYRSVPVLPERLQLLMSGQIKVAVLPEPLGFSALADGAKEIVNDVTIADYSASVTTFAVTALEGKSAEVKAFMRAWDKACAAINDNPEQFRPLLLQKIRVPKNAATTFPIPKMPRHALPRQRQWDDCMAWMVKTKLLDKPTSYQDSVTDAFLP